MNPDRVLTRYISFTKLISLIEQGLFIPKATLFQDELEGILPYFNDSEGDHVISKNEIRGLMDWIYVSCWHAQPHECHAMWKIYGESSEAVAIQTTERDLLHAYIKSNHGFYTYFDDVSYKNPSEKGFKDPRPVTVINPTQDTTYDGKATYAALFSYMKHIGYEYEKEVRLVAIDSNATSTQNNTQDGFSLPAEETQKIIKQILVHPCAPAWFESLVDELVNTKYKMNIKILRSSLQESSPQS